MKSRGRAHELPALFTKSDSSVDFLARKSTGALLGLASGNRATTGVPARPAPSICPPHSLQRRQILDR